MAGICDIYIVGTYSELLMRYQIWLKQSTVTHPAVWHDKVVNQQFAACSGSPHDDDNHLTSYNCVLAGGHETLQKEI